MQLGAPILSESSLFLLFLSLLCLYFLLFTNKLLLSSPTNDKHKPWQIYLYLIFQHSRKIMTAKPINSSSNTGRQSVVSICSYVEGKEQMGNPQKCQAQCAYLPIPPYLLVLWMAQFGIHNIQAIPSPLLCSGGSSPVEFQHPFLHCHSLMAGEQKQCAV